MELPTKGRRMHALIAVVVALLLAPLPQAPAPADLVDNYPADYFDCLPEPIHDLIQLKTRGNAWSDGGGSIVNELGWRVTIYSAVGDESGLTYNVKVRGVRMQALDVVGTAESDEWPSDVLTGGSFWLFQHPGGPSPNGGWMIENLGVHGTSEFDLDAHFCTPRD